MTEQMGKSFIIGIRKSGANIDQNDEDSEQ